MKLHEHKLCMEHFNECSACVKLEKRGVFARSQKTSNSNMDASLDEPTRQDDDIDDIEDQHEPLDMGRTCPVCNKILRSSNTYHLKVCAQKALGVIEDEHRDLGHDEHMDLFNIIATGSRLIYNKAGLDWCKGNCGRLISIDQQQHQLCGWNRRAPFEGSQQQRPPKDADRPSDFIEERIPIVQEIEELDNRTPIAQFDFATIFDDLPSLQEAACLPKFVFDTSIHGLHPNTQLTWAKVLASVLQTISKYNNEAAWTMWFMVGPCCLHWASNMSQGNKRKRGERARKEWNAQACNKMDRWLRGDIASLWDETVRASKESFEYAEARKLQIDGRNEVQINQGRLNRILHYISLNHATRAMQLVSREKPVPVNDVTINTLQLKFPSTGRVPEEERQFDFPFPPQSDSDVAKSLAAEPLILIEGSTIIRYLAQFPAGSSAGLSGITPGLLQVASRCKSKEFDINKLLGIVSSLMANGRAPSEVAAWIIGGRLIPVGAQKVRPIVVVDVLGRLTGKIMAAPVIKASQSLFPTQGGIGEKNAVERTAHMTQAAIAKSMRTDLGVMTIDKQNGYGEIDRGAALWSMMKGKQVALSRYFCWSYGREVNLVLSNGHTIKSQIGVVQGDPIAPIIYCFVEQHALDMVLQDHGNDIEVVRGHLDDTTLVGPVASLLEIYEKLDDPSFHELGLHMNRLKCRLYLPNQGIENNIDQLRIKYDIPENLDVSIKGIHTLGIPIGDDDFVQHYLLNTVLPELRKLDSDLAALKCKQAELFLWTNCGGITRVNHLLRSIDPQTTASFCKEVDAITKSILERCLNVDPGSISKVESIQAGLPKRMGGLALISAASISPAAYLGAVHAIESTPTLLQHHSSIIVNNRVKPALKQFNSLVHESNAIKDMNEFKAGKSGGKSQPHFTSLIHKNAFDKLMATLDNPGKSRLKDQTCPGASSWLHPTMWNNNTIIDDAVFPVLLRRHLGQSFFSPLFRINCPRSHPKNGSNIRCTKAMDSKLRHTDLCRMSYVFRHNSCANTLAQLVRYAGFSTDREVPCIPSKNVIPGDIYIHNGPEGIPIAIDVAVVSPLTEADLNRIHDLSMPAKNANDAERLKFRKYYEDFKDINSRVSFIPFGISTFGALGTNARRVIAMLVERIVQERLIPAEIARYFISRILIGHVLVNIGVTMSQALAML
jgi:hypothetical protein